MIKPIVNIITRTSNRESYFKTCQASIKRQTYPNINWIVGSDKDCPYYPNAIKLTLPVVQYPQPIMSSYPAPYNQHCVTLAEHCLDGLVMYLDDDDMFTVDTAVEEIVNHHNDGNQLTIWRVQITPDFIVPSLDGFGMSIQAGNISGAGIMFDTKHLPVEWGTWSYGDFRIIRQLVVDKHLQPYFIPAILTSTIDGAHGGKAV